jgi:hypothetical protein
LLLDYPSLLLHPSAAKPRAILWFWKAPNSAGDLWGFDSKGHLVVVELKRQLGAGELRKATSQIRKAARVEMTPERFQKEWTRLHSRGQVRGSTDFEEEFTRRMKHRFHPKPNILHLYIVAGHYTRKAAKQALKQNTTIVMMFELEIGDQRLVFSERLTD